MSARARGVVASAASLASAAALVLVVAAAPASARQDSGSARGAARALGSSHCTLERVGRQFVKCDDLTGNNVVAPGWVHRRR